MNQLRARGRSEWPAATACGKPGTAGAGHPGRQGLQARQKGQGLSLRAEDQDRKAAWNDWGSGRRTTGCGLWPRPELRNREKRPTRFLIDRHRACSRLRLHALHERVFVRSVLVEHGHRTVATGEIYTSALAGSNSVASTPRPIGCVVTILPLFASTTAITPLLQPTNTL